jgi:LPXTG-motif cell wall-anchored protein
MKRIAAALAIITAFGFSTATAVEAGDVNGAVDITYHFSGGDDALVAAGTAGGELFDGSGLQLTAHCSDMPETGDQSNAQFTTRCSNLTPQSYTIGVTDIDGYFVEHARCNANTLQKAIDHPGASFDLETGSFAACDILLAPNPTLYIDKLTTGNGPLGASDFTLEIYDDQGVLIPITPAIVDPVDAQCSFELQQDLLQLDASSLTDPSICAAVQLPPGDYTLGEVLPEYGYAESSLICENERVEGPVKILASPEFDFSHGQFGGDTLCTLTNDYVTQTVSADIEVINDGDGTATGADFTIEVFDNTGMVVASGLDPEPGTGNASVEFVLPIGPYTFGVEGPEGYVSTVVITAVPVEVPGKVIEGSAAMFTLSPIQTVAAVITADDPAVVATTTTTTTTTAAPTTTTAPTTAAPTTTDSPTAELPATGSSSSNLMLLAFALLALGGGTVLVTRRS